MRKNILNILILIIIIMFSFNINVKASDYASCYYLHYSREQDENGKFIFPIYENRLDYEQYSNPDNALLITIQYNSEKENYTTPIIVAKIISNGETGSLDTSQDFLNVINSDKGNKLPMTGRNPKYKFELPSINVVQLQTNDDKMMCPNVYLYGFEYNNSVINRNYIISLIKETNGFSSEPKYKKTLTPLSISKVSKGTTSKKSAFNCSYNIKDYKSTIFNFSGVIGFDVDEDGNVSNIVTNQSINNFDLRYEGEKLESCPTYIKLSNVSTFTSGYTKITVGSADSNDGVYNGNISTGEDNKDLEVKVIAIYKKYGEGGKTISIEKSAGNYNVNYNNGFSQPVNISNINNYMTVIESGKAVNLPKYIIKIKGGTEYIFVDNLKNEDGVNIETEEVYINKDKLFPNGTGLGDEKVYETCRELFGNTFLQLLYDYVFKAIWIGVPILLIVLTSLDFAKVVFVDDKDGIQKAFRNFGKRAIVAVLIFLTPYIVILIANLTGAGTTVQSCAKTIREMGNTIE